MPDIQINHDAKLLGIINYIKLTWNSLVDKLVSKLNIITYVLVHVFRGNSSCKTLQR